MYLLAILRKKEAAKKTRNAKVVISQNGEYGLTSFSEKTAVQAVHLSMLLTTPNEAYWLAEVL